MRHGNKVNKLGRQASHRKALMHNLAVALIKHKRITTTLTKGRGLRKYIEPLITKAKTDSTHARRVVFGYLHEKEAVTELFQNISQKIGDRPGGYTRVIKVGSRLGDNADMCMIELVDYNDLYTQAKGSDQAKKKRARRGKGSAEADSKVVKSKEKVEKTEEKVDDVVDQVEDQVVEAVESVETATEETSNDIIAESSDDTTAEETEEKA